MKPKPRPSLKANQTYAINRSQSNTLKEFEIQDDG